ncbi:hypothetical protein AB3538_11745 [Acinetobacter baumannii]
MTWFPVYLVKERHLSILEAGFAAVAPALCGFVGGILGGLTSDKLIRMNYSLSFSRKKAPIVVGFLVSTSIILCNYDDSQAAIVFFMSLSFFGKGIGSFRLGSDV